MQINRKALFGCTRSMGGKLFQFFSKISRNINVKINSLISPENFSKALFAKKIISTIIKDTGTDYCNYPYKISASTPDINFKKLDRKKEKFNSQIRLALNFLEIRSKVRFLLIY